MLSASKTAAVGGGYTIKNSLRMRSSASAYLNRTPASTGNQQKLTLSFWCKRGSSLAAINTIFQNGVAASYEGGVLFDSNQALQVYDYTVASTYRLRLVTTQLFRDPAAWYHIIVAWDTTQATAANRVKVYVNGSQVTSFSTATYPSQNLNLNLNNNVAHYIGKYYASATDFFDGYLAEYNFIDGQALTPSSFGETNSTTGVWQAKRYTGTYGTNGFYLPFSNTTSTTTLCYDSSGNGNNWTPNNISLTAGTTYDSMIDSPTITASATQPVGNYAVLNPLQTSSYGTLTDANLTIKGNSATNSAASVSNIPFTTGMYYAEFTITGAAAQYPYIGVVNTATMLSNSNLLLYGNPGYYSGVGYLADGKKQLAGPVQSAYGATFTANDVIGIAVDATNGAVYFSKNGTWQNSGDPTSGASKTGAAWTYTGGSQELAIAVEPYQSGTGAYANFGQRPFSYTPPTGYKALCTTNLPDSTIVKGNSYMDAKLYTGTAAAQNITGLNFSPDIVWLKERSSAQSHYIYDIVRGATKYIQSDSTAAETTVANALTSFNSDGWSLGSFVGANGSGASDIGWAWDAGSSTVTNTSGSISSQVRASTTAGVSVATYTGNNTSGATIGHGLGVAPKMVIVKRRNGAIANWRVYHIGLTSAAYNIFLSLTNAQTLDNTIWNSTAPNSTVFTVGNSADTNTTSDYVAYCFAEIAGFSKFGSYTGNGSTDGPFVYTGFRPKFIMIKIISGADNWALHDTSRSPYNVAPQELYPNLSNAESSASSQNMDILSNGFKLRAASNNNSGGTFIYAAFAENPFKNALAR